MLFPAKLVNIDTKEKSTTTKNITIECICPHWHNQVVINNAEKVPNHRDRGAQWPVCPMCNFNFDLPLRVPTPIYSEEMEDLFEKAFAAQGYIEQALEILHPFWDMDWQHPLATYLAADLNMKKKFTISLTMMPLM